MPSQFRSAATQPASTLMTLLATAPFSSMKRTVSCDAEALAGIVYESRATPLASVIARPTEAPFTCTETLNPAFVRVARVLVAASCTDWPRVPPVLPAVSDAVPTSRAQ